MMILNPLRNSRFGLGGGTPQLHHFKIQKNDYKYTDWRGLFSVRQAGVYNHFYGADIVSTGAVKANRVNPTWRR